ncbi:MAG TPA: hypothetical protein VFG56_00760 [Candidatus Saccharimonadales bacterium]|nr:hypothetical protein [Candidatus Saccharimonadales bacterium]
MSLQDQLESAEGHFRAAHAACERAKKRVKRRHGKPADIASAKKELARAERELADSLKEVRRLRRRALAA